MNHIANISSFLASPSYKVYTVKLTQTGTTAPHATILENTLGATPTWSRSSAGRYTLSLASAFPEDKISIMVNNALGVGYTLWMGWTNVNTISLSTFDGGSFGDDVLTDPTYLEIRVYN